MGDPYAERRWLFDDAHPALAELDPGVARHYLAEENAAVRELVARASLPPLLATRVQRGARDLVVAIRRRQREATGVDALLGEYDLSSKEGIVLMCLAEALLRIPDATTADRLIADKLGGADWRSHLGASDSLFVNASTWALLLTGRIVRSSDVTEEPTPFLSRLVERLGEPVVRAALRQAMKILGQQFVMGETIEAALKRAARAPQFDYSFDMLGEAALTSADAARYLDSYGGAIAAVGRVRRQGSGDGAAPSISVKLSALYPRYEVARGGSAIDAISRALLKLARGARAADVALTVDAEEADRLELSLAIFARVFRDPALRDYENLGLAVQAYQKRAPHVLAWLEQLARSTGRSIPVRLVKGAYWDTEIKRAQEQGLDGYPVFTRKSSTDVSYLACASDLLLELDCQNGRASVNFTGLILTEFGPRIRINARPAPVRAGLRSNLILTFTGLLSLAPPWVWGAAPRNILPKKATDVLAQTPSPSYIIFNLGAAPAADARGSPVGRSVCQPRARVLLRGLRRHEHEQRGRGLAAPGHPRREREPRP